MLIKVNHTCSYEIFPLFLFVQNTVARLKEFVQDHRIYEEALDAAASWLKMMEKRVKNCSDSSGDWHAIQDRIEDIKVRRNIRIFEYGYGPVEEYL